MDCNEVLEQLAEYLDEEARTELCKAIDEHLIRCRHCRFEVDTLKKTIVLYHEDAKIEMPVRAGSLLQAALASEYEQTNGKELRRAD